jgi:hypothetical protein
MDPVTIGLIARAAPAVLRTVAGFLTGRAADVAGKLATVAEATNGLGGDAKRQAMTKTLEAMTPDERRELVAVTVELRKLDRESRRDELDTERALHAESQATIRTEIEKGSEFARNSRPHIARQSFIAGAGYALICELFARLAAYHGVAGVTGADAAILATLLAPSGWYLTMRTVDSFSPKGRTV